VPRSRGYLGINVRSYEYLDGSLPGDYGWDPLLLGEGSDLEWFAYAELIHGRWAMLAAAGVLAPECLAKWGVIPESTGAPWFVTGGIFPGGIPFFGDMPTEVVNMYWTDQYTLFFSMMVLMSFAEHRRIQDYYKPGSLKGSFFLGLENCLGGSGKPGYPGGQFFNLFSFGQEEATMEKRALQEITHGRLAMIAMLGFAVQAYITRESPVDNLVQMFSSGETSFMFTYDYSIMLPFIAWAFVLGFGAYGQATRSSGLSSASETPRESEVE